MNKNTLKDYLKELNLNQVELAAEMGVTAHAISKWNRENKYPTYLNKYLEGLLAIKKLKEFNYLFKQIVND